MESIDGKIVTLALENGMLAITVDPNKDGQALLKVLIDILEVPDELVTLLNKKS